MTPAMWAGTVYEIALVIWGACLLWPLGLSPAARSAPRRLTAWNIQPIDFACYLCFAFVGATTLSAISGLTLKHAGLTADQGMVVGGAVMHAGILLGLVAFFRAFGARSNPMGPSTSFGADFRSGIATFLVMMPLVAATNVVWEFIITKLGLPDDKQDMVDILQKSHSTGLILLLVGVATLLVPITEELVFRAGLFRYARTKMPRWAAVLVTSVIFGALHMSWSSFAPLTVLAAVFCIAYERTGSIRTTMVAHALFNLNTFIIVVAGLGQ
jgi:membrane protease YdiL (CAAX protease family)